MAFDRFLDKAKNLAKDPKVKDKLNSDKAEEVTDSVLDKAAGVADSLTGGKHSEKIKKARDAADDAIGNYRGQTGGANQPGDKDRDNTNRGADGRGAEHGDDEGTGSAGSR